MLIYKNILTQLNYYYIDPLAYVVSCVIFYLLCHSAPPWPFIAPARLPSASVCVCDVWTCEKTNNVNTNDKPLNFRDKLTKMSMGEPIQADSVTNDSHWLHHRHLCGKQAHQLFYSLQFHSFQFLPQNIQPPSQPQHLYLEHYHAFSFRASQFTSSSY